MSRSHWVALALAAAVAAGSRPAQADISGRRFARVFSEPRAVPRSLLTDEGKLSLLVRLPPGVRAEERALLPVAPGFGSILLSPAELAVYAATYPDAMPMIAPPRRVLIDYASIRWTRARALQAETGLDGSGVVIGIIDTGLDTTHPDFLDETGQTRVAWLMQRGEPLGLHPELEQRYGCNSESQSPCAIYSAADIDDLLATNPDAAPRDEDGHGTHVASLAAGNGGLVLPDYFPAYAGVAPKATVIIASPSGGGGFRDADIVRAARFVFDRAEELAMPAVVNVSLGSDFGPHDGTGALEQGLASLVDGEPGRVVVVAAGNSGELYELGDGNSYGIHTEVHVSPNAVTRVPIAHPGADGTIEGAGFVWVNFRPGDEVSVGLEGPDGSWIGLTAPGEEAGHNDDEVSAGVVNNLVNGKTSLTEQTNGAVVFWDGRWEAGEFAILLEGRGSAQLWVTGTGGAAPNLATVGLVFSRALKTTTVAVPASHPDLIAVGCTLNRSDWPILGGATVPLPSFGSMDPPIEDSLCYFSGAGPTPDGGMKPDLVAPGAFVIGAMSRDADPRDDPLSIFATIFCQDGRVCTVADEWHAITAGTSMSAPQVAGAAALLLQREPNLTQNEVRRILQAGARRPLGAVPYDFQLGPGALDVVGALRILDEETSSGVADPAASFYVVASPYLRPDPGWPVEVVVQMRHGDGTVATEVSPNDFTIVLEGGLLVEPLTVVRGGMLSFRIAAPRGSGGTFVTLEVRYRGDSLGAHTLPVGVDAWAAGSQVEAVGGCALGGRDRPSFGWLLTALALARLRRRGGGGAR